jgi:DNA-binding NtrC family response regulator
MACAIRFRKSCGGSAEAPHRNDVTPKGACSPPVNPREGLDVNYKFLGVGDDELRRRELMAILRRMRPDWGLIEVVNTDEALRAIATEPVDIALVDLGRPGTDGLELAALMRRARPTMPIAVASAHLQADSLIRARQLKATFIPRPVTEDALAAFLTQAALRLQMGAL